MSWKRRNHAMLIYSACFVLYFCEKNAVMKSNGVKSISCVYLRRVRKAMWTHRAPPNPGPSSLLLCRASQRRSSSSLREKLFQNLFFFEKFDVYLEKFIQIQMPQSYWLFSFYVKFLAHYEKLKIPFWIKKRIVPLNGLPTAQLEGALLNGLFR